MGALQAATAIAGVGTGLLGQYQTNKQYQAQAKNVAATQAAQEEAAQASIENIKTTAEAREKKRLNLLKAELATQRAAMGASGVGSGGSSAAVQMGMAKRSDEDADYDKEMDQYKISQVTRSLSNEKRQNLMDLNSINYSSAMNNLRYYNNVLGSSGSLL
ncbi:MAG: hypothetical protein AB7U85_02095 [Alphaproteobacteria bacterium]